MNIENRKNEHIDLCLTDEVAGESIQNGLEKYRFLHNAMPELDFQEIELSTTFLGKKVKPLLVSSMTGGTEKAQSINETLATVAEEKRWPIALGSGRAALENESRARTYQIRRYAPTVPIIANLGAVQLNYGMDADSCARLVDLLEADALVFHFNSLQELFQDEGDTNFKGLLQKIEQVCKALSVPVGAKEVGWGISWAAADKLIQAGVQFIDVAGAGGTSWSQVEKLRSSDHIRIRAAEAFASWGIPTAECVKDIRAHDPHCTLIASGGMKNGVDAAKSIALGADLVGYGRSLLMSAVESEEALAAACEQIEFELRAAMFGIGARSISALKNNRYLV